MRSIAICLSILAVAAASGAVAQSAYWRDLGHTPEFKAYVNDGGRERISPQAERQSGITVTTLIDFAAPHYFANEMVLSVQTNYRVNCIARQTLKYGYTSFHGHMMTGGMAVQSQPTEGWTTPPSGTLDDLVLKDTCGAGSATSGLAALPAAPPQDTPSSPDADLGNGCGEPEIGDPSIVHGLNEKIGQYGGPPQRVVAIQRAASIDQSATDRHTRCHGTLVLKGGNTETGLLLQDSVNGVKSWRWHSDLELAQGANSPAHKKVIAKINDDMRRSAVSDPNKVVSCGVEGPQSVYTTNAVCYAVIKLVEDEQGKFRPYAGYSLLQYCGSISSRKCLGIADELRSLAGFANTRSKISLTEICATDLERRFPGSEKPQYLNSCRELTGLLR